MKRELKINHELRQNLYVIAACVYGPLLKEAP